MPLAQDPAELIRGVQAQGPLVAMTGDGTNDAPDDPRGADHVQHRQRRGQVLREHPGRVRRHLPRPRRAILSAVIFNALIIVALIPLALKGVRYRALGAAAVLRRHLWTYGVGGIIIPFPGIKIIDMILVALKLVRGEEPT